MVAHLWLPGVIISIQRQSARLLTSASSPEQSDVRVVRGMDIQRKVIARNLLTTDMFNNQVQGRLFFCQWSARD
jgi:hypothetical protein